ncbi:MAG: helix-turn-helix domain-containing protein [Microbacteriaceae bacterium]|nr:helix-turn-helix domain-containing protein [Microbacteriaceae bacterium]
MPVNPTTEEWQQRLGDALRDARLARRIDQETLADRADISTRSLRNLENGAGSSLSTLIKTVRALGREDWLAALDERVDEPTPLELLRRSRHQPAKPRRAPRRAEP